jgi:hypothetical protein
MGNDGNDDYAAIVAAITAAQLTTGGAVYFPAGTYVVGTRIDMSFSKDLDIFGDGNTSRIKTVGGWRFTSTTEYVAITIRDVRLSAYTATNATALEITCLPAAAIHTRNLLILTRVLIDVGNAFWFKGLVMYGAHNALITDCTFYGQSTYLPLTPPIDNNNIGIGYGLVIAGLSVNVSIVGCNFSYWEYGIHCAIYDEGLFISNTSMVPVKYGIYFASNTSQRSALLQIVNSHFDARSTSGRAIWCLNVGTVQLTNCYMIGQDTIIKLIRVFESTLNNNKIYGPAPIGIGLEDSITGPSAGLSCNAVTIIGNAFRGQTTNIVAQTGTRRIVAQYNVVTDNSADTNMTVTYMTTTNLGSDNDIQVTGT